MRRVLMFVAATVIAAGLATGVVLATGARAQMDGTSLKSIDAGGNTLVEMDGGGIEITPDTTFQAARSYRFGSGLIGLGYITSPYNVAAIYTDGSIQLTKYSSGIVWTWELNNKAFTPGGNDYKIGLDSAPVNQVYGTTFYAGAANSTTAGTAINGCAGGEVVQGMTVVGGIVTAVDCAAPPSPNELLKLRADNAALRQAIEALAAKVAALEASGARQ